MKLDEQQIEPRRTLIDVAQASGVSKATVSLVLRNNPSIPEKTRERVLKAAKELGYIYDRRAANMRSRHTSMIALAVNDITNPYFAEIVASIEDELTAQNKIVLMSSTSESVERQSAFVDTVREYSVDGIIMVPAVGTDKAFVNTLRAQQFPCVLISREVSGANVDSVSADHSSGMKQAVNHLIDLGHRRIGIIGLNDKISTGRDRLSGYRKALNDHGITIDTELIMFGAGTRDVGMSQLFTLLDMPNPPTAVVCFNDIVAFGAMLGLRSRGLTPGTDFSVIGFDDIAEATLWRPALTSVEISRPALAQAAVELLLRRISNHAGERESIYVPTKLVIRESTGAPRSGKVVR